MRRRNLTILAIVAALLVLAYLFVRSRDRVVLPPSLPVAETSALPAPDHREIGRSVEGRIIEEYTFGTGTTRLLLVGGIHGGYEWNSALLAYGLIDRFRDGANLPKGISVSIIPDLNPDGTFLATGKEGRFTLADVADTSKKPAGYGRFNARDVDLNRNFDCRWQEKSTWKGNSVSAGRFAFSEPEAIALKHVVEREHPAAVLFFHSQSGTVYASACENGILPDTLLLMDAYAKAAGYKTSKEFDAYAVTGDAEGWLASIGIPALTVELTTHTSIEEAKNEAGLTAVFDLFTSRLAASSTPNKTGK
jgi:predicted deacylase